MKPATLVKLLVAVGSIVSGIIAYRAWSYFNPDVARFGWAPEIWIGVCGIGLVLIVCPVLSFIAGLFDSRNESADQHNGLQSS
jgi:hypothetical protein